MFVCPVRLILLETSSGPKYPGSRYDAKEGWRVSFVQHEFSVKQAATDRAHSQDSTKLRTVGAAKNGQKRPNEAIMLCGINELTKETNPNKANNEATKSFRFDGLLERTQKRSH